MKADYNLETNIVIANIIQILIKDQPIFIVSTGNVMGYLYLSGGSMDVIQISKLLLPTFSQCLKNYIGLFQTNLFDYVSGSRSHRFCTDLQ